MTIHVSCPKIGLHKSLKIWKDIQEKVVPRERERHARANKESKQIKKELIFLYL